MLRQEVKIMKKLIISLVIISAVVGVIIVCVNHSTIVYEQASDDKDTKVIIKSNSFLQPATMGGQEYTIIIYRNDSIFKDKLLEESFWFTNDGATLDESNVSVEWLDGSVKVTVDSDEDNLKTFSCDF